MNKNNLLWGAGAVIVSVLLVVIFHLGGGTQVVSKILGTTTSGFTNLTSLSLTNILEMTGGAGTQNQTGFQQQVSIGTCATASSTIFDIANPFSATSTAQLVNFAGVGNATSTTFNVGTTTLPSGVIATTAGIGTGGSLVNNATIATTTANAQTQFYLSSGISTFLGSGQVSAGTSAIRIVVGPSEYVAGYATTSLSGPSTGLSYTGGYASCTYKIKWEL